MLLKLRGLNYPHERPLHAKGEVCTVYIFWVIGRPLIWGFIANSVLWPLFLKLRGLNYPHERPLPTKGEGCTILLNEENGFGLNWGQRSSVQPKIISTSQNYLVCKISRFFVHWGQFYSTFCVRSLTLLSPFAEFLQYLQEEQFKKLLITVIIHQWVLFLSKL